MTQAFFDPSKIKTEFISLYFSTCDPKQDLTAKNIGILPQLKLSSEIYTPYWYSLHMSQVVHQAGAYPSFRSMKRLGVLLLPPGWDANPLQGYPRSKFACTHLYTWVERGTMRVKCLTQEHNTVSPPGLEPRPLDLESNALTINALTIN